MTNLGLRLYYIDSTTQAQSGKDLVYLIDFNYLSQLIPLGVERFDMAGDARKTVQQTIGRYNKVLGQYEDNFYVDVWANSPDKIILTGVVKYPEAITSKIVVPVERSNNVYSNVFNLAVSRNIFTKSIFTSSKVAFLELFENIYKWNSDPQRRNDKFLLFDFIKQHTYEVTLFSRRYPMSVDKPGLVPWEINLTVLNIINYE
jgi:hypothetical protein